MGPKMVPKRALFVPSTLIPNWMGPCHGHILMETATHSFFHNSYCCGQLWVWHMFCSQDLWWAIPLHIYHWSCWDTIWIPTDHMDLCQTHCNQVPDFPAPKVMWSGLDQLPIRLAPSSSYLRVYMGCALAVVFQVRSLNVPSKTVHP